ncbi:MAG: dihydropteroate synthase [Candidatus Omnitrophica bacterium]|nr:dihydropteroate synthase [Candidatus Omnitrophota bacterium]MDD5352564.1 dihydropteroate synthase [Candidatus Omnitrophota bacterium]MDD5550162.1 dihydropteroate synthase [Candidatus Omnitrophota bacterium]
MKIPIKSEMLARILSFNNQSNLDRQLRDIKVDEYGIKIMSPKADSFLIKIADVSSIAANILKQEMLSLGGDVAISRQSITGRDKNTDCLLIGNFVQLKRLIEKLNRQPFGLANIGKDLAKSVTNYKKDKFLIKCRNYVLNTDRKTLIMGIINVTDDSFSGDGLLGQVFDKATKDRMENLVLEKAEQMIEGGADIIDIGAESTRPGAKPIDKKEEIKRISCCLNILVKKFKLPVSVDTYKPEVAKVALDLGASIINDITGLKDVKMRKLIAKYRAATIIMHMKGTPRTMQKAPQYEFLLEEVISFLAQRIELAVDSGISGDSIIIDPGIGFGKTLEHNLEILRNLKEFKVLGKPILLGVSRKSFLGKILNAEPDGRIFGTAAAIALSIQNGAHILRVHDVKQMQEVACVCDAIVKDETKRTVFSRKYAALSKIVN